MRCQCAERGLPDRHPVVLDLDEPDPLHTIVSASDLAVVRDAGIVIQGGTPNFASRHGVPASTITLQRRVRTSVLAPIGRQSETA